MERTCPSCNRALLKSQFNSCMICGAKLPEHLQLSHSEKQRVRDEFEEGNKSQQERRIERTSYFAAGDLLSAGSDFAGGD